MAIISAARRCFRPREGIPDRSHFKVGMKLSALYEEQKLWNEALEVKVEP